VIGQPDPQDGGERQHRRRGHQVDDPPRPHLRQRARHGPSRQDADEQTAHDQADDASPFEAGGERRGERHEHLGQHGERPHDESGG
jgi:hypothetical protein